VALGRLAFAFKDLATGLASVASFSIAAASSGLFGFTFMAYLLKARDGSALYRN
jgi:hypothetical protein